MKEDKAVGNDIEASENDDVSDEEKNILKKQFRAADFDSNKLLSKSEITMAISRETKQHILFAMRNNFRVFFSLDKMTKNGQVDWEEYQSHYLRDLLGLEEETIKQMEKKPDTLSRDIKESFAHLKAAWSEAAHTNPDAVNIDEFLGLEHPESSHSFLTRRVEELMGKFDADDDGKLSKAEYLVDPYRDLSVEEAGIGGRSSLMFLTRMETVLLIRRRLFSFLIP